MSYSITVRTFQTNPSKGFFNVVEKTVFSSGNWTEMNDEEVLTMANSGTSGSLRFHNTDTGEMFIATLGVHNYKRWGDLVMNLTNDQTGVVINPQYYSGQADRAAAREAQRAQYSVDNAKGRKVAIDYIVADGNKLVANIIIG